MRTHTQTEVKTVTLKYSLSFLVPLEMKISEKINLIIMILAYSAMKIRANPNPPYSMLKPDTSSDSPSAKSKGVRLVSARHDTNQIPTSGVNRNTLDQNIFIVDRVKSLKVAPKPK